MDKDRCAINEPGSSAASSVAWSQDRQRLECLLAGSGFVAIPIDQLADTYKRMKRLCSLGQATIKQWMAMPADVAAVRHAVFDQADFGALYAGQWLPPDARERAWRELKAEQIALATATATDNPGDTSNTDSSQEKTTEQP